MLKWITFIIAAIGLAAGIYTVATARQELPKQPPAAPPSVNPFPSGIAALGAVEPAGRQIRVVAPEAGMVTEVFAQTGQRVEKDAPLFQLDRRPLEAQLIEASAARDLARAQLERLRSAPRPEDVPALEAAVAKANAQLEDAKDLLERAKSALAEGGGNNSEVTRRTWGVRVAQANLDAANADLARLQAGTWKPELEVAEAQLNQANARISALTVLLNRLTVRAPITGEVLKRNVEPGEFAMANPMRMTEAAFVLGDLSKLHVRARVDEEDAPLLRPGARAVARVRGVSSRELALKMLRIEPLAMPKTDIIGAPTERIDTRVVEVVFEVEDAGANPGGDSVYPGQAVDVFIEAPKR